MQIIIILVLKKDLFIFYFMCMAVLSVYHECAWCPWWPEEGIRTTDQNGSHRWLLAAIWVLEVESRSCARQAGTLSHWAMSPGLIIIFLMDRNLKNNFWCLILLFKQWVSIRKKPSHVKNMFKKYTNKQTNKTREVVMIKILESLTPTSLRTEAERSISFFVPSMTG